MASLGEEMMLELQLVGLVNWGSVCQPQYYWHLVPVNSLSQCGAGEGGAVLGTIPSSAAALPSTH